MNMSSGDCSVKMGPAARLTRETLGLLPEQRGGRFYGALAAHGQSAGLSRTRSLLAGGHASGFVRQWASI